MSLANIDNDDYCYDFYEIRGNRNNNLNPNVISDATIDDTITELHPPSPQGNEQFEHNIGSSILSFFNTTIASIQQKSSASVTSVRDLIIASNSYVQSHIPTVPTLESLRFPTFAVPNFSNFHVNFFLFKSSSGNEEPGVANENAPAAQDTASPRNQPAAPTSQLSPTVSPRAVPKSSTSYNPDYDLDYAGYGQPTATSDEVIFGSNPMTARSMGTARSAQTPRSAASPRGAAPAAAKPPSTPAIYPGYEQRSSLIEFTSNPMSSPRGAGGVGSKKPGKESGMRSYLKAQEATFKYK